MHSTREKYLPPRARSELISDATLELKCTVGTRWNLMDKKPCLVNAWWDLSAELFTSFRTPDTAAW